MAHTVKTISQDMKLRKALSLIKEHITAETNARNIDLHRAITLIVDVAREHNLIDHNWSARLIADHISPMMYVCESCAQDVEKGGITDDEGTIELTGVTGDFYALCALCAEPATHEVKHAVAGR